MSDQQQPMEQPPAPDLTPPVAYDPQQAILESVRAIEQAAIRAAATDDTREMGEAAKAALAFAQTIVTLDPARLQGGDAPGARRAATPAVRDGDRDGQIGEKR